MFFTGEDQGFIAEFLVSFVLSGSHKNSTGALLFRSTKRRNDLCSFAADTDGNNQAVFSQNNRIHLHHVAVCNCFNIQSDTHETQLHLLCHQPGTASPVHIYSWHGNQKIHDPGDLTVVQKRAALVQKFLVSIEFLNIEIRNRFLFIRFQDLLVFIDKFPVSVKAAFLRET